MTVIVPHEIPASDALNVACLVALAIVIVLALIQLINRPGVRTWRGKARRNGR